MPGIDSKLLDISYLEALSFLDSPVHRMDARAKVITTMVFVGVVASFDRYAVVSLLPLLLFPLALVLSARLPCRFLLKRLLLVAPFALLIGILNPLLDQRVLYHFGSIELTGGWISFVSILLRFVLTVGTALILIAITSMPGICNALERLGTQRIFALQLLLLYRYIFVLGQEAQRKERARALRSFHGRGKGLYVYGALLTQLLWRTIDRAQRVHRSMLCRGFNGQIHLLHTSRFSRKDGLFTFSWCLYFLAVRFLPTTAKTHHWFGGVFG